LPFAERPIATRSSERGAAKYSGTLVTSACAVGFGTPFGERFGVETALGGVVAVVVFADGVAVDRFADFFAEAVTNAVADGVANAVAVFARFVVGTGGAVVVFCLLTVV
jgi:hypothetical protein